VRTLDTNVVVRLLIGDDPQQTPIAERAFLEAIATGGVYLGPPEKAATTAGQQRWLIASL
jgi:predicted nucleic-acid-binding protein